VDSVRDGCADDAVGAALAMQMCDLAPQLTVLVVEFADAFVRQGQALS